MLSPGTALSTQQLTAGDGGEDEGGAGFGEGVVERERRAGLGYGEGAVLGDGIGVGEGAGIDGEGVGGETGDVGGLGERPTVWRVLVEGAERAGGEHLDGEA